MSFQQRRSPRFNNVLATPDTGGGGAVQNPFAPVDAPNPVIRVFSTQLLGWININALSLSVNNQVPVKSFDWTNPILRVTPTNRLGFTQAAALNNIGQDTFHGAVGQGEVHEYPNPRVPVSNTYFLWASTNLFESLLAPTPIAPIDWPNPLVVKRATDNLTLLGSYALYSSVAPLPPFSQLDWPNPQGVKRSVVTSLTHIYYYVVDDSVPFYSQDWPNPLGYSYPINLRTWVYELQESTLTPKPFLQTEWPNPRGKEYPSDLRTFLNNVANLLTSKDLFFGQAGQGPVYDWPNPLRATYPSDLRTFVGQPTLRFLGQDTFYGAPGQVISNLDWPVPKGYAYVIDLKTQSNNLLETTLFTPVTSIGSSLIIVENRFALRLGTSAFYIFIN